MRRKKYEHMAYQNSVGKEWIQIMTSKDVWDYWCKYLSVRVLGNWYSDPDRPEKIFTVAIWYLGYSKVALGGPELRMAARRLRSAPPERGTGALKKGLLPCSANTCYMGYPIEFYWLEEFLEHVVRPRMSGSAKLHD